MIKLIFCDTIISDKLKEYLGIESGKSAILYCELLVNFRYYYTFEL